MKCPVCDYKLVKANPHATYDIDCPQCGRGFKVDGDFLLSLFCADGRKFPLNKKNKKELEELCK